MSDLFLAAPWWLLGLLVVVGLVVAWSGNKRSDARTRNVGLGLLALAAVLFTVGFFYETDTAKVQRLNAEMVQSVPKQDWSRFADLLAPDATLGTVAGAIYTNRDAIVKGAKDNVAAWGLQSVSVTSTMVKQDAAGITLTLGVYSNQTSTQGLLPMVNSSWQMDWQRDGKTWRCKQITCLEIGRESGASAGRMIHR